MQRAMMYRSGLLGGLVMKRQVKVNLSGSGRFAEGLGGSAHGAGSCGGVGGVGRW